MTNDKIQMTKERARRKQVMASMTSSKDMTWATPWEWFLYLDLEFGFTLDPCCHHETAKCVKHYTPVEDGLKQNWGGERVFMNPPYGRELPLWMKKAHDECRDNGALVVAFVPARVDTLWWKTFAEKADEIRFPMGRVKFEGAESVAPFPQAVIVFRPKIRSGPRGATVPTSNE